jgi:hypothetical protein
MLGKRFIPLVFIGSILLFGSTSVKTLERSDVQDALVELTEAQIRAQLREDRQFFPRSIPQEVHGQIERESRLARQSIAIVLVICLALLFFCIFPLFEREKVIVEMPGGATDRLARNRSERHTPRGREAAR